MKGIDISKYNKVDVLIALYNAAKPQGSGFLHYDSAPMTKEEALSLLDERTSFDYLKGRVMKVHIDGDMLDPCLYDRDNGNGATQKAINTI